MNNTIALEFGTQYMKMGVKAYKNLAYSTQESSVSRGLGVEVTCYTAFSER